MSGKPSNLKSLNARQVPKPDMRPAYLVGVIITVLLIALFMWLTYQLNVWVRPR